MRSIIVFFGVSVIALALSGCTPVSVAAGAGATLGIAAAQEGGIKGAVTDDAIRLKITELWMKHNFEMYRNVDMTVKEGRVLITGAVPAADMRVEAVRLVWQAEGVRQVINEVRVDDGDGVIGYAKDATITSSLKTKMMFDKYIQSINYTIESNGGTVYLMGVAQDQKELDRVLNMARNTQYAKNVISYVRLRGEMPSGVMEPTNNAGMPASAETGAGAPAPEAVESESLNPHG